MFEKINKWFKLGLWTKEMVADAVVKGKISEEDYKEITGEDYSVK